MERKYLEEVLHHYPIEANFSGDLDLARDQECSCSCALKYQGRNYIQYVPVSTARKPDFVAQHIFNEFYACEYLCFSPYALQAFLGEQYELFLQAFKKDDLSC